MYCYRSLMYLIHIEEYNATKKDRWEKNACTQIIFIFDVKSVLIY